MYFIPTSITAIIVSIKEKLIDWKIVFPITTSGIIGAVVGARASTKLNVFLLKKCFGIFLGIIAMFELYLLVKQYRFEKRTNNKKEK